MLKLKRLTSLNLIWINQQSYWVYNCQTCGQVKFEKQSFVGDERRQEC